MVTINIAKQKNVMLKTKSILKINNLFKTMTARAKIITDLPRNNENLTENKTSPNDAL